MIIPWHIHVTTLPDIFLFFKIKNIGTSNFSLGYSHYTSSVSYSAQSEFKFLGDSRQDYLIFPMFVYRRKFLEGNWKQQIGLSTISFAQKFFFHNFLSYLWYFWIKKKTHLYLNLSFHASTPIYLPICLQNPFEKWKQKTNKSTFLEGNFYHFL